MSSSRQRIIEATFELIGEQGLASVTMSSIAGRAAVSRQTLYNHFGDVDEIVGEGISAHEEAALSEIRVALGALDSPAARLRHLVRHACGAAREHGSHASLQGALGGAAHDRLAEYDRVLRALIAESLVDGARVGEIRTDVDPDADALLFARLLDGIAEMVGSEPERASDIEAVALRTVAAAFLA